MLQARVIPCLLLKGTGLVKTTKFKDPKYVGDPINAVNIFNEKEVDELIFLDITATLEKRRPNFKLIAEIASECFMPFAYGGGITELEDMRQLFKLGVEKVVVNSVLHQNPGLVAECARIYGSQSIIGAIDVKKNFFGKYEVYIGSGTINTKKDPVKYAQQLEELGVGEIFINAIDRDGTMEGYDSKLINMVTKAVNIPVIACGGAGKLADFQTAVTQHGASAVAAGSFFVFHGKHKAVLITYPPYSQLVALFN